MNIFHLSMECYPMAKVGGLADVVGSLPKYCQYSNHTASVVIPHYDLPWFVDKNYKILYTGEVNTPYYDLGFTIQTVEDVDLGFPLYLIDIPQLFFRKGVYSTSGGHFFPDEAERQILLQRAFLQWVDSMSKKPDILHCHDHHTALIPYMIKYCPEFKKIAKIPTILTIHNERYQGVFTWNNLSLMPASEPAYHGLLEWDNHINSLASGIKNAWQVTTVSPHYMEELITNKGNLEWLFQNEKDKCVGILNGIDPEVWDPSSDPFLEYHLKSSVARYKYKNKEALCDRFGFIKKKPIVSFIGRLALEKGADLIAPNMREILKHHPSLQLLLLGTGNPEIEKDLILLEEAYPMRVHFERAYDEGLSHQIYAGTDFLLMPSRVEPCGLNQMYTLAYGGMPVVHGVGGLVDTVSPYDDGGNGIVMDSLNYPSWSQAFRSAVKIYGNPEKFISILEKNMKIDHSWNKTAKTYIKMYKNVQKRS